MLSYVTKKLYLRGLYFRGDSIRYVADPYQGYGSRVDGRTDLQALGEARSDRQPDLRRLLPEGDRRKGVRLRHRTGPPDLPGEQVPLLPRRRRVQLLPPGDADRPPGLVHLHPRDRHPARLRLDLRPDRVGRRRIPGRRPLPRDEARPVLQGLLPLAALSPPDRPAARGLEKNRLEWIIEAVPSFAGGNHESSVIREVRGRRRDTSHFERPGPGPGGPRRRPHGRLGRRQGRQARRRGQDHGGLRPAGRQHLRGDDRQEGRMGHHGRRDRELDHHGQRPGLPAGLHGRADLPARQEPQDRPQAGEAGRRLGHRPGRGDLPDPRGGQRLLQGRQVRHGPDDVRGVPDQEPRRLPGPPEHRRLLPREGRVRDGRPEVQPAHRTGRRRYGHGQDHRRQGPGGHRAVLPEAGQAGRVPGVLQEVDRDGPPGREPALQRRRDLLLQPADRRRHPLLRDGHPDQAGLGRSLPPRGLRLSQQGRQRQGGREPREVHQARARDGADRPGQGHPRRHQEVIPPNAIPRPRPGLPAGGFFLQKRVLLPFPGFLSRRRGDCPRRSPLLEEGTRAAGEPCELVPREAGEPEDIPELEPERGTSRNLEKNQKKPAPACAGAGELLRVLLLLLRRRTGRRGGRSRFRSGR
ncbi:MAG: hypothetical protein MZV64_63995 [Ignavibacteriales bacterium]|nr:hypothetical protein [Ignavibacteriales bacterium]